MSKRTPYWQLLQDPRWQKKRLEIFERDEFRCQFCGDKESTLTVHHRFYIKGRSPWEYPDWALVTLCNECHDQDHSENPSDFECTMNSIMETCCGRLGTLFEFMLSVDDWKHRGLPDENVIDSLRSHIGKAVPK